MRQRSDNKSRTETNSRSIENRLVSTSRIVFSQLCPLALLKSDAPNRRSIYLTSSQQRRSVAASAPRLIIPFFIIIIAIISPDIVVVIVVVFAVFVVGICG